MVKRLLIICLFLALPALAPGQTAVEFDANSDGIFDDTYKVDADNITAGSLTHERGGLEGDVSDYDGMLAISGGAVAEVNTAALLETYAGLGAFANEYLDDANAAAVRTTLGLVIGTDVLAEQTVGIADDNLLEVDGSPNDDEYARFTANGLEGRTESEFKADFNLVIGTDVQAVITEGSIPNDMILEEDLKAVDAAGDEECLTFEETTGDFEWQTCGAGSGDVVGPASSTDNAVVKMNLDTGKLIQEETDFLIDDDGVVNKDGTPSAVFYDSDAAGAALDDERVCTIHGDFADAETTEDAENGDIWIECVIAGSHVTVLRFDATDDRWESTKGIATTGDLNGTGKVSEVTAATYTLGSAAYDSYGTMFINGDNDAVDFTLESAAAGMMACFAQEQGVTAGITVQPNTGDYLVVDGVRGTAATDYTCTAANCKICVWAQDATDWIVFEKGTWSE